jgi:hypothetical protein
VTLDFKYPQRTLSILEGIILADTMKRRQKRKHLEIEESKEAGENSGGIWWAAWLAARGMLASLS